MQTLPTFVFLWKVPSTTVRSVCLIVHRSNSYKITSIKSSVYSLTTNCLDCVSNGLYKTITRQYQIGKDKESANYRFFQYLEADAVIMLLQGELASFQLSDFRLYRVLLIMGVRLNFSCTQSIDRFGSRLKNGDLIRD